MEGIDGVAGGLGVLGGDGRDGSRWCSWRVGSREKRWRAGKRWCSGSIAERWEEMVQQERCQLDNDVEEWCCPTVEALHLLAVSPANAVCLPNLSLTGMQRMNTVVLI